MNHALICAAVRTPFGNMDGALSALSMAQLASMPIVELMRFNPRVDWARVEQVLLGCGNPEDSDALNLSDSAAGLAGLPTRHRGQGLRGIERDGLGAVHRASQSIENGSSSFLIAGGVGKILQGAALVADPDENTHGQSVIAEISLQCQHSAVRRSQIRYAKAADQGFFEREVVGVDIDACGSSRHALRADEIPLQTRRRGPVEQTAGLPTSIEVAERADGACAIVLASESAVARNHLIPRARIRASNSGELVLQQFGIAPAFALRELLHRAGVALSDLDVIEIDETFAWHTVAIARALGLNPAAEHVNPNGGALALGDAVGASGVRLLATALNQLERIDGRFAACLMADRMGSFSALLMERVK